MRKHLFLAIAILLTFVGPVECAIRRTSIEKLVARIQRADYEGDRAELQRLYAKLEPVEGDPRLASRVHYWRGFALWRRVFNGFNDNVDAAEQKRDMELALAEFNAAIRLDPSFADAKAGQISCGQTLAFLNREDPEKLKEIVETFVPIYKEAFAAHPDHPRMLWVVGAQQNYDAMQRGGDRAVAEATFRKGAELARKTRVTDPLEPSWGEPENLMSLAYMNLYAKTPDVAAAETYAKQALALVPHWRYVRDVLMKQIEAAKAKP
jgi:tetratricopeptide (TPR) repeat protein